MKKAITYLSLPLALLMLPTVTCGCDKKIVDVFMAGSELKEDSHMDYRATLWENGVSQRLTEKEHSQATAVYVSDDDVYVAGMEGKFERKGSVGWEILTWYATLWKNGLPQRLSKKESHVFDLYVSGDDVYIVGYENDQAMLWKNGVSQRIGGKGSYAYSIYVSGNDVYVAGCDGRDSRATLWKNGVAQPLSDQHSYATSVFVSGNDVYVVGTLEVASREYFDGTESIGRAVLWKNGVHQPLSDQHSHATSVFVSGKNVYVTGYIGEDIERVVESGGDDAGEAKHWATLWKNGVPNRLSEDDESIARSIFVSGKDMYVAGYENDRATLWKNGVRQSLNLGDYRSYASSIFVIERGAVNTKK